MLLEFAEKPYLKITYNNLSQNGRIFGDKMEIGNYEKTPDEKESLLATMMHEFGHYLDLEDPSHEPFNSNSEVIKIFNEEFEEFLANTTTEQQKIIQYFTNPHKSPDYDPAQERIAETHSMLYSITSSANTYRQFYLAQYFPRTMAAIMELLLEEEGIGIK